MRYFLFHKPFRVLTQFSPEGDKQTLAHYLKGIPRDVYPAGRLDYDSEGLLLLTNDSALTGRLLDPDRGHPRTYWVQVEGIPDARAIAQLEHGVTIRAKGKEIRTRPAVVAQMDPPVVAPRNPPVRYRKEIPDSWISITLTEGKNRQVRRMTAAVGLPTLRLIRYSIGNLTLDGMEPGSWKEIKNRINFA